MAKKEKPVDLSPEELAQQEEENKRKKLKAQAKSTVNPVTGLSGSQMSLSYWWVSHWVLFRKIGLTLLFALAVSLVGYSAYSWGMYGTYGYWKERTMLAEMAQQPIPFKAYHAAHAPQPLVEEDERVLDSGTKAGWQDVVIKSFNPNERWVASVTYRVEDGEDVGDERTMSLLPGRESVMGVLGYAPSTTLRSPHLVQTGIDWKRINPHDVPDPSVFIEQRLDFPVDNVNIIKPGQIKDLDSHAISFDITNNTVHSYWSVPFWVLLYRNNTLVGVEQVVLDDFELGDSRSVDVRSLVSGRSVTRVEVLAQLDVFDKDVYKPLTDNLEDDSS